MPWYLYTQYQLQDALGTCKLASRENSAPLLNELLRGANAADFSNNYFMQQNFLSLAPGFSLHKSSLWMPGLLKESCFFGVHVGRAFLSQHSSGGSTDKFCIFWLPILGSLVVMIVTRYKLALPLSGKKCSLHAPTVNCVMLLLTPVCLLILDTSVRVLIAMIMTASSWSCWGLPQLKGPSINNIKRIWRLQFSFVNPGFWVVSDYLALIAI